MNTVLNAVVDVRGVARQGSGSIFANFMRTSFVDNSERSKTFSRPALARLVCPIDIMDSQTVFTTPTT